MQWAEWLYPPKIHVETVTISVMLLGRGEFGMWLGREGGIVINAISALIKGTPETSLALSVIWGFEEKLAVCNHEERLTRTWQCCTLNSNFESPELCKIKKKQNSIVYKPLSLWYFVVAAWTKTQKISPFKLVCTNNDGWSLFTLLLK